MRVVDEVEPQPGSGTLYLVKANNELVSRCGCPDAYVALPQPDVMPWTGTGFLFRCLHCGEPFSFAKATYVPESLEELAVQDLEGLDEDPTPKAVQEWVESMALLLEQVKEGREYVYLDGSFLPTHAFRIELEGWTATHNLTSVPQVEALRNRAILRATLEDPRYWIDACDAAAV